MAEPDFYLSAEQRELQRALRVLVEEHGRMTSGAAPDTVLLEWALIKILGKNVC